MCNKQHCLVFQQILYTLIKYVSANLDIKSRHWVVKEIDVTVAVQRSGKTQSLFLTTAQGQTSVSNLICQII